MFGILLLCNNFHRWPCQGIPTNHWDVLKNLEVSQNSNSDLLKENVEYLKKELNSKDELIKSLTHRQQY